MTWAWLVYQAGAYVVIFTQDVTVSELVLWPVRLLDGLTLPPGEPV